MPVSVPGLFERSEKAMVWLKWFSFLGIWRPGVAQVCLPSALWGPGFSKLLPVSSCLLSFRVIRVNIGLCVKCPVEMWGQIAVLYRLGCAARQMWWQQQLLTLQLTSATMVRIRCGLSLLWWLTADLYLFFCFLCIKSHWFILKIQPWKSSVPSLCRPGGCKEPMAFGKWTGTKLCRERILKIAATLW